MLCFPNVKINIGLNVIEKRPDGYHNIESLFYPAGLCDALEIVPLKQINSYTTLHLSGNKIDCPVEKNLVYKAFKLMQQTYKIPEVEIYLHKNIPHGGGLGGGSADGAFTLKTLNKLFELNITDEKLVDLAIQLGSDCPFFIYNKPAFISGKGEKMVLTNDFLRDYYILIVIPEYGISTSMAYSSIIPAKPKIEITQAVKYPVDEWKNLIFNDFEKPAFKKYPELALIKQKMYESGAVYASMSGSGSSIYGIFREIPACDKPLFAKYFTWVGML